MNRREFFLAGAAITGGMVFYAQFPAGVAAKENNNIKQISDFVQIMCDGRVLVGCNQPEMGQDITTCMIMCIAEELEVDWQSIEYTRMPLGLKKAYEQILWKYGPQLSSGSATTRRNWEYMREVGAQARNFLVSSAAKILNADVKDCSVQSGVVKHLPSNNQLSYYDIVKLNSSVEPSDFKSPQLSPSKKFTILGKDLPSLNTPNIVYGKKIYCADIRHPNMKFAAILRCPYFDGKLKNFDGEKAMAINGVSHVFELISRKSPEPFTIINDGVAVVANSTWAAIKGKDALKTEWEHHSNKIESSLSIKQSMEQQLAGQGLLVRNDGNFNQSFAQSEKKIKLRYEVPLIAHIPMEPPSCYAFVQDHSVHVTAPVQRPRQVAHDISTFLGIDIIDVSINLPVLGGSFGRKLTSDFVLEAVMISKKIRRPVLLQWSREDDIKHDFYRPSSLHEIQAGIQNNQIIAWKHSMASTSKFYRRKNIKIEDYWKSEFYPDDFPANIIPNYQLEYHSVDSKVPRGSLRAPGHNSNAFVVQSFIAELAGLLGKDHFSFLHDLLNTNKSFPYSSFGSELFEPKRLAKCLQALNNSPSKSNHTGVGYATHFTFGSYCAHKIEVEYINNSIKIKKISIAVDCGLPIHPRGIESQIIGGTIDALSAAMFQEITIDNDAILQSNFHDYKVINHHLIPDDIKVIIIPNGNQPEGVGEIAYSSAAPALANAIDKACGIRLRSMPFSKDISFV
ncbi:xanthine dehydrogenase family protein molybdopterin-binding subunit [Marinicella meishanensis]|uniref:xanthine dehydrogenase family protein molybdopterin-binding subunit n=1 Tax=Marinicella meishanensis TaxID=2873263 RepID=UPI001CC01C90|nr:molybdopterin cofactor-binding domain-containing protein [Marinicella sp. NBU2979]